MATARSTPHGPVYVAGVSESETLHADSDPRAHFRVTAELVRRGPDTRTLGVDWPSSADSWRVTVICIMPGSGIMPETPRMSLDYRTGTGNRRMPGGGRVPHNPTAYDAGRAMPCLPSARDVLSCIGSEISTAMEMPRDDGAAMDYLADEWGMSEGKPSAALATVRALRKTHDDAESMLRGSGVTLTEFAEFCQELGS